ncbi:hypothetical protein PoB_003988200 [Plakobranchus ocellatus]|uniref:Uncharacterized protein n=1 Tax=Plakobranchus ocellatus TaxID=259542 RepID=A0AAV4B2D6_9GAST|nr:hypothetical protein PoB_003988200 [Plakobranchus ocellatus]
MEWRLRYPWVTGRTRTGVNRKSTTLEVQSDDLRLHCKDPNVKESIADIFGSIKNKLCTVLRDTGCSSIVIDKRLVREEDYTAIISVANYIDGSVAKLETAKWNYFKTPFFIGRVIVFAISDLAAGVLFVPHFSLRYECAKAQGRV